MHLCVATLLAAVVLFFGLSFSSGTASAQPAEVHGDAPTLREGPSRDGAGPVEEAPAKVPHTDKAMALLFWLFAAGVIGGSIFVITRRNLIAAVMGMVGTFFAVAALYMMLYAGFMAVIQVLVYAGAIMVLFVFVVMILNKPEDEPWGLVGIPGKILAGLAMAYLLFRVGGVLWSATPANPVAAAAAPPALPDGSAWGSVKSVGTVLFTDYLFPFEAVSILLLIAVVGAIAVARPLKDDEPGAQDHGVDPGSAGH
jgi:NADH-quinone oxidoreductase subunit J